MTQRHPADLALRARKHLGRERGAGFDARAGRGRGGDGSAGHVDAGGFHTVDVYDRTVVDRMAELEQQEVGKLWDADVELRLEVVAIT